LVLTIALGPILLLGVASFLVLGSYALIPLALGGIAAASFAARERADGADAAIGLLTGLGVWLVAAFAVAVLFVDYD
jgi:hypothetical protein